MSSRRMNDLGALVALDVELAQRFESERLALDFDEICDRADGFGPSVGRALMREALRLPLRESDDCVAPRPRRRKSSAVSTTR